MNGQSPLHLQSHFTGGEGRNVASPFMGFASAPLSSPAYHHKGMTKARHFQCLLKAMNIARQTTPARASGAQTLLHRLSTNQVWMPKLAQPNFPRPFLPLTTLHFKQARFVYRKEVQQDD